MRALGLLLYQRRHSLVRLGEALERIHACPTFRGSSLPGRQYACACLDLTETIVRPGPGAAVHLAPSERSHTQCSYAHFPANEVMRHQAAGDGPCHFVLMFHGPFDVTIVEDASDPVVDTAR